MPRGKRSRGGMKAAPSNKKVSRGDVTVDSGIYNKLKSFRGPNDANNDEIELPMERGVDPEDGEERLYDFPAKYLSTDTSDDRVELKRALLSQESGRPFGDGFLERADLEWARKKQAQIEEAQFDAWFADGFDMTDPVQRRLALKLNPKYFERREKAMMAKFDLAKRLGQINLRGIQTRDDLEISYALARGIIQAPEERFWEPRIGQGERSRFRRGIMNPTRAVLPARQQVLGAGALGPGQADENVPRLRGVLPADAATGFFAPLVRDTPANAGALGRGLFGLSRPNALRATAAREQEQLQGRLPTNRSIFGRRDGPAIGLL